MSPKDTVMNENITLGPSIRTAMVAGSWKVTLATVYTNIATDYFVISLNPSLKLEIRHI